MFQKDKVKAVIPASLHKFTLLAYNQYVPKEEKYVPKEDRYVPKEEKYVPKEDKQKRDKYSNQDCNTSIFPNYLSYSI